MEQKQQIIIEKEKNGDACVNASMFATIKNESGIILIMNLTWHWLGKEDMILSMNQTYFQSF